MEKKQVGEPKAASPDETGRFALSLYFSRLHVCQLRLFGSCARENIGSSKRERATPVGS
jgi:hypothetical protein